MEVDYDLENSPPEVTILKLRCSFHCDRDGNREHMTENCQPDSHCLSLRNLKWDPGRDCPARPAQPGGRGAGGRGDGMPAASRHRLSPAEPWPERDTPRPADRGHLFTA